jgi:pyruvate ferredoxin oxidoreductase gamma subunit
MIEIRWHARAGQGAKTASQVYAVAMLRAGKSVQAFPEYGPERRGAPVRAYTRVDDRPIRRHDSIEEPDVVVVLEPSLMSAEVTAGLADDGFLLVNDEPPASEPQPPVTQWHKQAVGPPRTVVVPADRIAAASGSRFVNLVMLGALATQLAEPELDELVAAAVDVLGRKVPEEEIRAAIAAGYWEVACPA